MAPISIKNFDSVTISTTDGTGQIDGADVFDGADDYVTLVNHVVNVDNLTVCAWIKPAGGSYLHSIIHDYDFQFYFYGTYPRLRISSDGGSTMIYSAQNSITLNAWQQACVVRKSDGLATFYVNGLQSGGVDQNSGTPSNIYEYFPAIGANPQSSAAFNGTIDEVRVSNAVRSAEWIATEYNNQSDISQFLTFGSESMSITCIDAGGICKTNTCSVYTDCSLLSGLCDIGNCCSGTCTIDTIAPATISNLNFSYLTSDSIKLTWTSPGDDNNIGTATTYDIRYSTTAITDDTDFNNAIEAIGEPSPNIAGSNENFILTGLTPATPYYFAIKTSDEIPHISGLSNILNETTPAVATINAKSCSVVDINMAIGLANAEDTILVPAGNCDWDTTVANGGQVILNKSINLIGAGQGVTNITITDAEANFYEGIYVGTNKYRISGFTFSTSIPGLSAILVGGFDGRIDHCTFNLFHFAIHTGLASGSVIDNNIFYGGGIQGNSGQGTTQWSEATLLGTNDFLFVEDNVFSNAGALTVMQRTLQLNSGMKMQVRLI